MVKRLSFRRMNMPSKWPIMPRDAHVKREDGGDTIVVRTSGACESRLLYRAGGTDSVKKLTHLDHAVVVAMGTMRKMQMAVNQIVDMVAVRNRLMPARRSMAMR